MMVSKKAFMSITILLFTLFFLGITLQNNFNEISDFIIIKQLETKKQNIYLNFEKTLENNLDNCLESDPLIVKEKILFETFVFGTENNFFIQNIIDNNKENYSLISLNEIIKVIVYKPNKYVTIKEVHITKGLFYDKTLGFSVENRKYKTTFYFPENYILRKVVFC